MQWFLLHARVVAAATLVSLVTVGGLTSLTHGAECHDEECFLVPAPHDPASHSLKSASTSASGGPLHCVLCHWTRSVRPSPDPVLHLVPPAAADILLRVEVIGIASPVAAAQPPLRSPPLV